MFCKHKMSQEITESVLEKHIEDWSNAVNRSGSVTGNGRNWEHTVLLSQKHCTENYCNIIMLLKHRSAIAKLDVGLPLCGLKQEETFKRRWTNMSHLQVRYWKWSSRDFQISLIWRFKSIQSLNRLPFWKSQNCSMFSLAFVAGW